MNKRPVCRAAAAFLAGLLSSCLRLPGGGALFFNETGDGLLRLAAGPALVCIAGICRHLLKKRKKKFPAGLVSGVMFFLAGAAVMGLAGKAPPVAQEDGRTVVTGKIYDYQIQNDTVCYYIKTASAYHGVMVWTDRICFSEETSEPVTKENSSPKKNKDGSAAGDFLLSPGMTVRAEGVADAPEAPTNPGQFDLRLYDKSRNIDLRLKKATVTVLDGRYRLLSDGLKRLRSALAKRLLYLVGQPDAGVLSAMLFGEKSGLDQSLRDMYQRNGIAHVLAISGLHISILGMCVYKGLRKIGCPMIPAGIAGSLFTFCFGLMIGMPVSALRAVVMYVTALAAQMLGRTYDMASALSLAAMLVLFAYPYALFASSMQYSFGAVAALMLLPKDCWKKIRHKAARRLLEGLTASAVITFCTLPVQLYHSYTVSPYGCLLNVAVIPSMSLVLLCGLTAVLISFPFGGCLLPAAKLLFVPCRFLLFIFRLLCETAERLPFHLVAPGRPVPWRILLFYLCLAVLAAGFYRLKAKKRLLLPMLAVGMCLLLRAPASGGLEVSMLDVGQGECLVIRAGDGRAVLSDGGSTDVSGAGVYRIRPFLLARGISQVEAAFISHWDEDHISGIRELLEENGKEITIKRIIIPDGERFALKKEDKEAFRAFVRAAEQAGASVQYVSAGDVFSFSGVTLSCLAPGDGAGITDVNGCSAVYVLGYGEFSMLLTGDLPMENEEEILNSRLLSGRVLKVAHHGSKSSTSRTLLEKLRPALSLISCGKDNSYGHPHEELLERLVQAGSRYYCTARTGAVCMQVRADGRIRLRFGQDSPFNTILRISASTSMAFNSS